MSHELLTDGQPLLSNGISFPKFGYRGISQRVHYVTNRVEYRNIVEIETDGKAEMDDDVTLGGFL